MFPIPFPVYDAADSGAFEKWLGFLRYRKWNIMMGLLPIKKEKKLRRARSILHLNTYTYCTLFFCLLRVQQEDKHL